ncbi:MAG: 4Fe-4S binding protein [Planctomycetota bacterium]|jgi:NAD-dependent dihydropyrimidine dehydrogenase PreA subunit
MMRFLHITVTVIAVLVVCGVTLAVERFPPPDFVETDHQIPTPTVPGPRQDVYEYLDVIVLAAALALSSYLVLKRRSRRAIFALMVFSLVYFGFWRKGCVCSIGAIQNVALSVFDSSYAMPVTILLFFSLPLVFTLFFGRTFCAAVCPLGAVQDLVALRPMSVPRWLENGLRLLAYVYLGLAVLFAATGSAFVICRYDPFVAFFRLSGNPNIIILGACFILIGVFVGRPYCRFICPYGVVLRQFSRLSKKRVTITPDECVKCRLCEDSCPFGAIRQPTIDWPKPYYQKSKTRLALLLVLLPVLALGSGWLGSSLKGVTSRVHSTVRLADRIHMENEGKAEGTTDASDAFRATGKEVHELYDEASVIIDKFALGGWFFGGFIGLVIGLKLIGLSVKGQRTDYEADQASCLACGRCFEYCPREHLRLKNAKERIG